MSQRVKNMTDEWGGEMRRSGGTRLRAWRRTEGLRLADIAGLTGFSVAMISLVENGLRQFRPKAKVLMARRLGVPVEVLFKPERINEDALVKK